MVLKETQATSDTLFRVAFAILRNYTDCGDAEAELNAAIPVSV